MRDFGASESQRDVTNMWAVLASYCTHCTQYNGIRAVIRPCEGCCHLFETDGRAVSTHRSSSSVKFSKLDHYSGALLKFPCWIRGSQG